MKSSIIAMLLLLSIGSIARPGTPATIDHPSRGKQYETLRFQFAENLHVTNPFDLETNRVELSIQQPDYSTCILSFFYNGVNNDGIEQWEARYAPKQTGQYRFTASIMGTVRARFEIQVEPTKGKNRGGLKLSGRLGMFEYETGEPFRGIGINVCWTDNYEYYFRKMQAVGMTVTRIWMCPWNLPFEWNPTGLGRYDLETARKLDSLLELADRYGIYVILCMDYHGIAPKGPGFFRENRWLVNPYNRINGGPCVDGADLFTNADAKSYMKQKYKYIVSRFGHSSRILAWEFLNEADLMAGKTIPVNRWHVEMGEYIHSIDVHHRLVSSSSTRRYMEKLVDAFRSPALDFVMFHDYNTLDIAPHFTDLTETAIEYYQKPVVLGEFGIEFRGGDLTFKADSQHVGLHNGIWSGWFSETPIIPLSWWWDNYIDLHDLWHEYGYLTRFASSMDFSGTRIDYKTLPPGFLNENQKEQAPSMVRCIYTRDGCALWFKNDEYKWWLLSEGRMPKTIGAFTQEIPDLVPGNYAIRWFDPQNGQFSAGVLGVSVNEDGILRLPVPAFAKDRACLVRMQQETDPSRN